VTVDSVTVDSTLFEPIRVSEDQLEGLVRTAAPALFPGYDYFDFRPPIRCGLGTRHPDGALLCSEDPTWWIVETETHLHSVEEHIEPQLSDLAGGFYGPEAFAYLRRHRTFDESRYSVNTYEPSFLLVIDSLTAEIREAAARTGFQPVECTPFRSIQLQYALAVSGSRPRRDVTRPGPGLDLALHEDGGMAVLLPADGKPLPLLPTTDLIVADSVYASFVRADRLGIVLPVTPDELRVLLAGAERYRLTAAGHLHAVSEDTQTLRLKE
jgi:hypothetical protein